MTVPPQIVYLRTRSIVKIHRSVQILRVAWQELMDVYCVIVIISLLIIFPCVRESRGRERVGKGPHGNSIETGHH